MTSEEFRTDPMFMRNQFKGEGIFEFPTIRKQKINTKEISLIGYDKIKLGDKENANHFVHFFLDDYKFESLWNDPEPRLKKLSQYRGVLSPQFSAYYTMPFATQLYQTFRSRWCGAYMQSKGLTVIPTVYWGKPQTYWYCFDGIEQESVVAVSTVGVRKEKDFFLQGYTEMLRRLKPKAIICYGAVFPEMDGKIIEVDYAESNHLGEHKKFWTVPSDAFSIPSSGNGIRIVKAGTVICGYGSGGGGRTSMGRSRGKTPRNNQKQNGQTDAVAQKLGLTKDQQRELHDLVHGQGWGYQEILEFARQWFQK